MYIILEMLDINTPTILTKMTGEPLIFDNFGDAEEYAAYNAQRPQLVKLSETYINGV
jgi:hypothetical protein